MIKYGILMRIFYHLDRFFCKAKGVIFLSLVIVIASIHLYGIGQRTYLNGLDIKTVRSEADIYRHWSSLGLKGRVIVYLSRHLNFIPINELGHIDTHRGFPVKTFDISRMYSDSLEDRNFLYVSAMTGVGRRIYHIIPVDDLQERLEEASGRDEYNVKLGMPVIVSGSVIKTWQADVERFIMPLTEIKPIREPVLLAIHPSFFESSEKPEDVLSVLKKGIIKADSVVFCIPEDYPSRDGIEKTERLKWSIQGH